MADEQPLDTDSVLLKGGPWLDFAGTHDDSGHGMTFDRGSECVGFAALGEWVAVKAAPAADAPIAAEG